MNRKLGAIKMWFYRMISIIPSTENVSNKNVLRKMQAKKTIIDIFRKRQLKLFSVT